jgi:hypothetical protein
VIARASVVNWGDNREYFDRLCHSVFGLISALAGRLLGRAIWATSRRRNREGQASGILMPQAVHSSNELVPSVPPFCVVAVKFTKLWLPASNPLQCVFLFRTGPVDRPIENQKQSSTSRSRTDSSCRTGFGFLRAVVRKFYRSGEQV